MKITVEQLELWLEAQEGEHFEFKEAKNKFDSGKLAKYCCALSNEGGGHIILGVTDQRPRKVVGSNAFLQPERTRNGLINNLAINVNFDIVHHPDGRVLVFSVPDHPVGIPVQYEGIYWMRSGDSLVPMSPDKLKAIFDEAGYDFSAEICPDATLDDLSTDAIEDFRQRWISKSGNRSLQNLSPEQLLHDAEVIDDGGITYAALVLFGTHRALGRHLAQSEVVFEYRSSNASGPAQQRKEYRQGFFLFYDDLWNTINLRNNLQHYQEGLFVWDIPTFEERPIREAILNAICHRDYRSGGSVFIRQLPDTLNVESPGGFPSGITVENVLDRQNPRNRRIAELLAKCGMVERSGQGMNLMFEYAIKHSKLPPDFTGTDQYQVMLTLQGQVKDPAFVRFIEKIGSELQVSFVTQDFLVLDMIHRDIPIPEALRQRIPALFDHGVLERVGRGRGTKYVLSKRFYTFLGKRGAYTRKRGLDRETNKALLLKHIKSCGKDGARLEELRQVLPSVSFNSIQWMLRQLKADGTILVVGMGPAARWLLTDLKGSGQGQNGGQSR